MTKLVAHMTREYLESTLQPGMDFFAMVRSLLLKGGEIVASVTRPDYSSEDELITSPDRGISPRNELEGDSFRKGSFITLARVS